jgi:hypothetical protein
MPFILEHNLVSEQLFPETHESGGSVFFTVSAQGEFDLLFPGRLVKQIEATVRHSTRIDTPDTTAPDLPGGIDQPMAIIRCRSPFRSRSTMAWWSTSRA